MIRELLAILQEEGLVSPAMLAQRLNTSLGLVELMLADLERSGYLQQVNSSGCGGCTACGEQQDCLPIQSRIWSWTGKVKR